MITKFNTFVNEGVDGPDWFSGIEFGKARNDFSNIPEKGVTNTIQKKIDSLHKKSDKINAKLSKDPNIQITVRKSVMAKTEKVSGKKALDLIDDAISGLRMRGYAKGIIVYA